MTDQFSPRTVAEKDIEGILRKHRLLDSICVGEGINIPEMFELALPRINETEVSIFTQYDIDKGNFQPKDFPSGRIFSIDVFNERTPKYYNIFLDIRGTEFGVVVSTDENGLLREGIEIADYFDNLKPNQDKSIRNRFSRIPHLQGELFVPAFEEVLKLYKHYTK